jgi:hypothetical protein
MSTDDAPPRTRKSTSKAASASRIGTPAAPSEARIGTPAAADPPASEVISFDYRDSGETPKWGRELIEAQLAIDAEDAAHAGQLGFMARAMVIATMPHKDPKVQTFFRKNGDFSLRMTAGAGGGLPFGIYPRLLMSWVTTEAVRRKSPTIYIDESMGWFLKTILGVNSSTGGRSGTLTRITEQMKRLFGALITAEYEIAERRYALRNVVLADELLLDKKELARGWLSAGEGSEKALWTPQSEAEAGQWYSCIKLSQRFYDEIKESPVPIDLRAYKALRNSPLAMDVYTWLTFRMSYTRRRTRPIRWEGLQWQMGSGYAFTEQGRRDFKKAFLKAMKAVETVYPDAKLEIKDEGVVLLPSATSIRPKNHIVKQPDLF